MRATGSVPNGCGYVVTDNGRQAMAQEGFCACRIVLLGFWAVCPDCGTCYANIREELARSGASLRSATRD